MTTHTKEKIYHGISLFCIVLCMWLIGQVAADELLNGRPAEHLPPLRSIGREEEKPRETGLAITEEQIEGELMEYLPQGLSVGQPEVTISTDGALTLAGTVDKAVLLECFRTLGIEPPGGSLLAVLAPKQIELEVSVQCAWMEESGDLTVTPRHMILAGNRIEGETMPKILQEGLCTTVAGVLTTGGQTFTSVRFSDGAIYLE